MAESERNGLTAVYHIASNPDGTLQPILNVLIRIGDEEFLKDVLETERPGGQFFKGSNGRHYFIVYDTLGQKPFPSVMIWRCSEERDGKIQIIDVDQEDLIVIPRVCREYLGIDFCDTVPPPDILFLL